MATQKLHTQKTDFTVLATTYVSRDANAPRLECECGHGADTYVDAHDDAVAALRSVLEHVAFDHITPRTAYLIKAEPIIDFTRD